MSDFKAGLGYQPLKAPDAVPVRGETDDAVADVTDLPVNTYDDYKTWCDKVRQEWDIN